MLYVLGGTPRSGKTLLSRRAVAEKQIPYFPLDALFYMLVQGAPEFGVHYDNALVERPLKMWRLTKHLFGSLAEDEREYLIEGDSILPSQISELIGEGKPIKGCFLGYTELTTDEKFSMIRTYHQGDIDWTKDMADEKLLPMIDEMIEFSKFLKEECSKYGIKYFDVSHDFEGVRNQAFEYLFSN